MPIWVFGKKTDDWFVEIAGSIPLSIVRETTEYSPSPKEPLPSIHVVIGYNSSVESNVVAQHLIIISLPLVNPLNPNAGSASHAIIGITFSLFPVYINDPTHKSLSVAALYSKTPISSPGVRGLPSIVILLINIL